MEIRSYKDLIVWQKSLVLVKDIYVSTEKFPQSERYGLVSQLRRAAVSIVANIAEGYSRHSRKDYLQFVRIAFGSAREVETLLIVSKEVGFLSQKSEQELQCKLEEILKMLNGLVKKLQEYP